MTPETGRRLLELQHVTKVFAMWIGMLRRDQSNELKAVDDVSLVIDQGVSVGVVGESGSGKTTLARIALGLIEPTEGSVAFRGVDMKTANKQVKKRYRSSVQAVFQDPWSSL